MPKLDESAEEVNKCDKFIHKNSKAMGDQKAQFHLQLRRANQETVWRVYSSNLVYRWQTI